MGTKINTGCLDNLERLSSEHVSWFPSDINSETEVQVLSVDLLQMTPWLTNSAKYQRAPAKKPPVLSVTPPRSHPGLAWYVVTETCSQGRWLASCVCDSE